MLRFRFLLPAAVLAVLALQAAPARAAQPGVAPGILVAVDTEMQGFANKEPALWVSAFTNDAVLIDDSEPLFMQGHPQLLEWFSDFWRGGVTAVTLRHDPATDYSLGTTRALAAFPFTINIATTSGKIIAKGVWTGTFVLEPHGAWKIRSLTISLLSFRTVNAAKSGAG